MGMNPLIKKAYWSLAAMGALYFVFLGCLANPWVQRKYVFSACYFIIIGDGGILYGCEYVLITVCCVDSAIYMNLLKVTWRQDLTKPEEFGFASTFCLPPAALSTS
jgi:abhydrolase domain-containing protein 12